MITAQKFFEQAEALGFDEPEAAIACYDRISEVDPMYSQACYNKGLLFNQIEKGNDAIFFINRAIELEPNNGEYYQGKGSVLYSMDRLEEALAAYDQALQLGILIYNSADYDDQGQVSHNYGRTEPMNNHYQVIRALPYSEDAYAKQLQTFELAEEFDAQIYMANQLIGMNPTKAYYYTVKGHALLNLGRESEALEAYGKSLELDPTNPDCQNDKCKAYSTIHKFSQELKDLRKYYAEKRNHESPAKVHRSRCCEMF